MAAYQPREVKPLRMEWRGHTVYTAPPTAGGLTVFQGLAALKALDWDKRPVQSPETTHLFLETLRVAWDDRLRYVGDPDKALVPVERLLSEQHARDTADRVEEAVRTRRRVRADTCGPTAGGTVHLSVA